MNALLRSWVSGPPLLDCGSMNATLQGNSGHWGIYDLGRDIAKLITSKNRLISFFDLLLPYRVRVGFDRL